MNVPTSVWIVSAIIIIVLSWMTFWVTNKAYSRRWDEIEVDKKDELQ
ncbi:hypothetical protein PAT3040_00468 [Paenibacillus agaridevorans]|jgi:hypothetical protein|uniref:Uncharacterized protein n=1 Tax=Paenibacillus agaridevorans TaxID=171404 RepID=A0A2R5EK29_9BACL|nr:MULTISPECIES: hypothetical protein [Paenibacillus]GBG05979.1 hypothetical protein PAT3040_00468 [Paenibacillus agaridevorans]